MDYATKEELNLSWKYLKKAYAISESSNPYPRIKGIEKMCC